jgi:hypothetical protein
MHEYTIGAQLRLIDETPSPARPFFQAGFSLVSNHQTDITSFDEFLKLILNGFILLFWLGLELVRVGGWSGGRVWVSYIAI